MQRFRPEGAGKGDSPRPIDDLEEYGKSFDRIFGKKCKCGKRCKDCECRKKEIKNMVEGEINELAQVMDVSESKKKLKKLNESS